MDSAKLLDAWMPPEDAGAAVACLATTFTFEPEFFEGECLSRFLSLDTARNEEEISELSFLIEQEERLGETRATVVVDRSYQAEGRSLRWDVLPVGVRGGVQHAKVSVLLWEQVLRVAVSSANVVSGAYRRNVEAACVFDVSPGIERRVADTIIDLVEATRRVVESAFGDAKQSGPKQRALETLALADSRTRSMATRRSRTRMKMAVSSARLAGGGALDGLSAVWAGNAPTRAFVLSPFFDVDPAGNPPTAALLQRLRGRGAISATYVVPVDYDEGMSVVRAPRSILNHRDSRTSIDFREFPRGEEPRRLHAKAIRVESSDWVAAIVGSSNFTTAGLGLTGRGNLEINVALGAPADSTEAVTLRALIPLGDLIDPDTGDWEPEPDDDEAGVAVLPFGFAECLLDPPPRHEVILRLHPPDLPPSWTVELVQADSRTLLTSAEWRRGGEPREVRASLKPDEHPFLLRVSWGGESADWPLNVTDPARLPPPERLRELPAAALIEALASTRPLHEALAAAIERQDVSRRPGVDVELDPLRRYSSTGHLFQRTRKLSAALEGIRRRLERPAGTLDVLLWRLKGPFGPRAVAEGLLRDESHRVDGEAAFFIAELALSLSRLDWALVARYLEPTEVKASVRNELRHLRQLARKHLPADPKLSAYIERALRAARV